MAIVSTIINAIIDGDSLDTVKAKLSDHWVAFTEEDEVTYVSIIDQLIGVKLEKVDKIEEDEDDETSLSYSYSY